MFQWVFEVPPYLIAFVLLVLLVLASGSWGQPRAMFSVSRWSGYIGDPEETPEGFYTRYFNTMRERLAEKPLPFSSIGFGPKHLFAVRSALGPRPVYLMLRYREFTYYVHAMPAPGGILVSSWTFSKYTHWEEHPILKWVLAFRLYQQTLFQFDVLDLFHGVMHNTLMDVIESYREEQGLEPMTEQERRPILQSYFAKFKEGPQPQAGYGTPVGSTGPAPVATSRNGVPPAKRPAEAPPTGGVLPIQTDPLPQASS